MLLRTVWSKLYNRLLSGFWCISMTVCVPSCGDNVKYLNLRPAMQGQGQAALPGYVDL